MLRRLWVGTAGAQAPLRVPQAGGTGFRKEPVRGSLRRLSHGAPHGWQPAEQPALGDDPELLESDELTGGVVRGDDCPTRFLSARGTVPEGSRLIQRAIHHFWRFAILCLVGAASAPQTQKAKGDTVSMEVIKVTPRGYCYGVVDAMEIARKAARDPSLPRPIYIIGLIVHNRFAVEDLNRLGFVTLDGPNRVAILDQVTQGTVIFTAHGVSPSVKDRAHERGLHIIDATCPDVTKTHDLVH